MQLFFQDVIDISKLRVRLKGIANNTLSVGSLWNTVEIKLTKIIFPFLKQELTGFTNSILGMKNKVEKWINLNR